jgi:hypothetical protein
MRAVANRIIRLKQHAKNEGKVVRMMPSLPDVKK